MLMQIHENQKLIKNFLEGHGQKKGCWESGQETLDLTVSQEWIDGINWFFCMLVQVQES